MGERRIGDRYRLDARIGRSTWRAYDKRRDIEVYLAKARLPAGATAADLDALTDQATAESRLRHPHIVTVHDVVVNAGKPWIVTLPVEAEPLDRYVARHGPFDPPATARIGSALLGALAAARAAGIRVRAVTPSNVLLTPAGTPLLVSVLATVPALDGADERAGSGSDLRDVGLALYHAVEGRGPFEAGGTASGPAEPEPVEPQRAGALGPIILGLLIANPALRLPADSARSLLRAVALAGDTGEPPAAEPITGEMPPPGVIAPTSPLDGSRATVAATDPTSPTLDPALPAVDPEPEAVNPEPPGAAPEPLAADRPSPFDGDPRLPAAEIGPSGRTGWRRRGLIGAGVAVLVVLIGVTAILGAPGSRAGARAPDPPAAGPSSAAAVPPAPSRSARPPAAPPPVVRTRRPAPTPTSRPPRSTPPPVTPTSSTVGGGPTVTNLSATITLTGPRPTCGGFQSFTVNVSVGVSRWPTAVSYRLWNGFSPFYHGSGTATSGEFADHPSFQVRVTRNQQTLAIQISTDYPSNRIQAGSTQQTLTCA